MQTVQKHNKYKTHLYITLFVYTNRYNIDLGNISEEKQHSTS